MLAPTSEEVLAFKAEARKRFGSDRVVGVQLWTPFDLIVAVAALDLASATEYEDARRASPENARSALLSARTLWPTQEKLEEIRSAPGTAALDALTEQRFRDLMGFDNENEEVPAVALSELHYPPGFASAKEAPAKVAALIAANAGSTLWSIHHRRSGLSCILRGPISDVWGAIMHKLGTAMKARRGLLSTPVPYACDLCVWAPGLAPGGSPSAALTAHIEEAPGRAELLVAPLTAMGGAYAETRASFL